MLASAGISRASRVSRGVGDSALSPTILAIHQMRRAEILITAASTCYLKRNAYTPPRVLWVGSQIPAQSLRQRWCAHTNIILPVKQTQPIQSDSDFSSDHSRCLSKSSPDKGTKTNCTIGPWGANWCYVGTSRANSLFSHSSLVSCWTWVFKTWARFRSKLMPKCWPKIQPNVGQRYKNPDQNLIPNPDPSLILA